MADIIKLSDYQHPDPYVRALARLSQLGKELDDAAKRLRKALEAIKPERGDD